MGYKLVKHIIKVPLGHHCWSWTGRGTICGYFDNEGGHSTCDLGFSPLKDSTDGVLKPSECDELENINEEV